ncbi:MAG: hypothetical protein ACPGUC_07645 [Gammaproteobacteria bacterium]
MTIRLPAKELKQALTGLLKILPRKGTRSMLQGIRIEAAENTVRLTATDLDSTVYYACTSATVREPGVTVIADARRLKELVAEATRDEAQLSVINEQTVGLTLYGERGEREHLLPTADFVDWPADPTPVVVKATDPLFLKRYQTLIPFASTDASRAILTGICVDVTDAQHTLVATDGRRLLACNSITLPVDTSCVLPANKFLASLNAEDTCRLGLSKDLTRFQIETGPWTCVGKTIEGTYPNWRQVIPQDGACGIDLHEDDLPILKEVVRTFPVSDPSGRPLYIERQGPQAGLAACDPATGAWSHQALPKSNGYGKGTCVNRTYLHDAVKAGFRRFRWQDERSPLVARNDDGGTCVLMPLRADVPPTSTSRTPKPKTTNTKPQKENKPVIKTNEESPPNADAGRVEQLWLSYQAVRDRVRELNGALSELGDQLREVRKADKGVRAELKNARGVLAKLQNMSI